MLQFFYLGEVGTRGIIFDFGGKVELQFTQGLGRATKNHAKIMTLWKGIEIGLEYNYSNLNIFGDSMFIIHQFTKVKTTIASDSAPTSQRVFFPIVKV